MVVPVDKLISFHIEKQFPAIYREEGQELVQFVKEYYKFLETNENQSLFNGRRMFEYRDIDETLEKMLTFFKNKYLADLPFDDSTVRIIVKNILGLYRRKGTEGSLELFFRLFYNEFAKVYYPARDIAKPSNSKWQKGSYLQLFPNAGIFTSTKLSGEFVYNDIINRTIFGAASRARATVDKINFIILNNTFIPIIFINDITGDFLGLEDVICEIDGVPINFGIVDGSLTSIDINIDGSAGNAVGDQVTFRGNPDGIGATGLVTKISDATSGSIIYNLEDGGWGYTVDTTSLHVSDQLIFIENDDRNFVPLEILEDDVGNRGFVVGQGDFFVGVKMDANSEFTDTSVITTVDRLVNIDIQTLSSVAIRPTPKNATSPGDLYPDTLDTNDVIVAELENVESIGLIFDVISNFVDVPLDAINYNDVPPALVPMSGNADPVDIDTRLDEAFNVEVVEIGTIVRFDNIDPGFNYVNDVVALPYDSRIRPADRKNQLITISQVPSSLNIGDEIDQGSTKGKVLAITDATLTVRPYKYYGFNSADPITYGGDDYEVIAISRDFGDSEAAGQNAIMDTKSNFAVGIIEEVEVIDSGYGYAHNTEADVLKDGVVVSRGILSARGQGSTGGFWSSYNSHLNGYVLNGSGNIEYYNSGKFIHDNNYYQEYSYEVQSKIDVNVYEKPIKETVHVAGTKVFGRFNLEEFIPSQITSRVEINRSEED